MTSVGSEFQNQKYALVILTIFLAIFFRAQQSNSPGPNTLQIFTGAASLLSFPA